MDGYGAIRYGGLAGRITLITQQNFIPYLPGIYFYLCGKTISVLTLYGSTGFPVESTGSPT
jgi:hypothetical protein